MKKINNKGFTLIELLAVITIMGILMLVAIPAVSRTIENARRDTFQDVAKEYINAVRNAMLADNISCYDESLGTYNETNHTFTKTEGAVPKMASSLLVGTYYFPLCSEENAIDGCTSTIAQNTNDLMESGGTSPFGGAYLVGYVKLNIATDDNDDNHTKSTYSILLADVGNHGFTEELNEKKISRTKVALKNAKKQIKPDEKAFPCELN